MQDDKGAAIAIVIQCTSDSASGNDESEQVRIVPTQRKCAKIGEYTVNWPDEISNGIKCLLNQAEMYMFDTILSSKTEKRDEVLGRLVGDCDQAKDVSVTQGDMCTAPITINISFIDFDIKQGVRH